MIRARQVMTAQKIQPLRAGESLPFAFDRGGLDITGWECLIVVKQYPGDAALISGTVTPTNGVWAGYLTSTQTAAFDTGKTYRLMAILTNAETDEEEQIESRFSVTDSWSAVA